MPTSDPKGQAPTPMAGGQPISEAVAEQAAEWLTLLMSGEATEQDQLDWQQWRRAHPDHERAWQHIEAVTGRLRKMESKAGYQALSPFAEPKVPGRRNVITKALSLIATVGITGLFASHTDTWKGQMADLRTGAGERRTATLDDGTQLDLNTATAVNLRFDGQMRLLQLVKGEILVTTATPAGETRPFIVATEHGRIRALGTRFAVRRTDDGQTHVAVHESAIEITPVAGGQPRTLQAGEQTTLTKSGVAAIEAIDPRDAAWMRGQIIADDTPLGDFDLAPGIRTP